MRFKEWLAFIESSYRPEDVPPYFYVAMNNPSSINFDDLANGVVKNINGVSEDFHILKRFYDSSTSIGFIMPGRFFVNMNKVTRFMYENPHFWTQPDFSRDARRSGSGSDWLRKAISSLIYNDPELQKQSPVNRPFAQLNPQGQTVSYLNQNKTDRSFVNKINQVIQQLSQSRFNNVGQLSKVLHAQLQQVFPEMSDLTKQKVYDLVYNYWIHHKENNSQDKEWVLKDKIMNIPKGSKMLVENKYEAMDEIKQRWDKFNSYYNIANFNTDDMENPSFEFLPDEEKSRGNKHIDPRYATSYQRDYYNKTNTWTNKPNVVH